MSAISPCLIKVARNCYYFLTSFYIKSHNFNKVEARRNENYAHKRWQEHRSQMMNEVTSLKNELVTMQDSFPDEYDSSALSSPTKSSSEEGTHETFHKFPPKAEERDHKEGELQEEEENEKKSLVAKMIKNHESIIRQKNEELYRIKHQKKALSSRKRKELSMVKEKIHILSERFDNLIRRNEKQGESLFNQKAIYHRETLPRKKLSSSQEYEIDFEKLIQENVLECYLKERMNELNEKIEANKIKRRIREDVNFLVFFEARKKLSSQEDEIEFEKLIQENVYKCYLKEMMNELNEKIETNKIKRRIREDTNFLVFFEAIKDVKSNHEFVLAKENLEDEIKGTIKEDMCMLVIKKTIEELNKMVTNCKVENIIREQIDQIVFEETLEVFVNISNSHSIHRRKNINVQENFSTMVLNQVHKFQGHENLTIILLESLLGCFEAEENIMLSAHSEIKEHSKQLDLGSERGDLHEYELFEDLITGEEQTFSSLTSKVENVLQQLGLGKALLKELGTSLGHRLRDSESFHRQMFDKEQEQLKVSSFESTTFIEFEAMVYQKLEMLTGRLEKMKCCVDSVIKMVAWLRRNELLYQKAFIRRCLNLQNAEAEVDLLGDQVDALLTLLEKIYATLHQHAPALKQHFEVFNILELIKTEAFQAASVMN